MLFIELIVEGIAVLIITLAVFKALPKAIRLYRVQKNEQIYTSIRLELGLSLALSLEFLLAADILGTAISPSWNDIGILASIAGIRTFLNFFLEKEVIALSSKSEIGNQKRVRQ